MTESIKPYRAPKTYEQYEYLCRIHLIPALGRTQLEKLTPDQVQRLLAAKLSAGLSPASVMRMRAVLRAALNRAMKWGLVTRNVTALTDVPSQESAETTPLSLGQVDKLLTQIQGERFEALYVVALATGLREGEILGLHWRDVDFERRLITVRTQVQRTREGLVVRELKTRGSYATVPMAFFAADALKVHWARQRQERLQVGPRWQECDLVFPSSIGTPMDARNLLRDWHRQRRLLDVPECTFHDLRHTCASILYAKGVAPKEIQAILRQTQLSITMDLYTHIFAEAHYAAADAMDAALQSLPATGGRNTQKTGADASGL